MIKIPFIGFQPFKVLQYFATIHSYWHASTLWLPNKINNFWLELTVIQSQLYQPATKGVNRWSFAAISASHSNTSSTPRGNQSPGKDQRKSRKRMLGIQPGKKNDVAWWSSFQILRKQISKGSTASNFLPRISSPRFRRPQHVWFVKPVQWNQQFEW